VLELGLDAGHAWRELTREGACSYRHFEYHEIWKHELGVPTYELVSGELQQVLRHIISSGLRR
jgi:hypothetical protein